MSTAEQAIMLIIRAVNVWLAAAGHPGRVTAHDVQVLQRGRQFVIAFEVEE